MQRELHLSFNDKNARVLLSAPTSQRSEAQRVSLDHLEVTTTRVRRGLNPLSAEAETIEALIAGDSELNLEQIGVRLEESSRAFVHPESGELAREFETMQVIYSPNGEELERKPYQARRANINQEATPVTIGKQVPRERLLKNYVIVRVYQLLHDDGIKFDFLYNIARELDESGCVALLGAGAKGSAPLVFSDNGRPYRCALAGRVRGDEYKLLILVLGQELKRAPEPEPESPSAATTAETAA